MRVRVMPMYRLGAAYLRREGTPAMLGDLRVAEQRDPRLGRAVTLARLVDAGNGDADVLPELRDMRLLWMREREMRLTGLEHVDDTAYAQTWHVEVL